MSLNAQLDFFSASFCFFETDEVARSFFLERLIKLLDTARVDSFRDTKDVIEILMRAKDYAGQDKEIKAMLKKYSGNE